MPSNVQIISYSTSLNIIFLFGSLKTKLDLKNFPVRCQEENLTRMKSRAFHQLLVLISSIVEYAELTLFRSNYHNIHVEKAMRIPAD